MILTHKSGNFINVFLALAIVLLLPVKLHAAMLSDWQEELKDGQRLLKTKELEKAEVCFRQAYKDVRRSGDRKTDALVLCIESLAALLYMEDQVAETIPLYKKSLRLLKRSYGKNSIETVPTIVVLAGIYEDEGDFKKAVKLYTRALDITAKADSVDGFAYADYQARRGRVKVELGLLKQAEEDYLASLTKLMAQESLPSNQVLVKVVDDYTNLLRKTEADAKTLRSKFQNELLKDQIGLLNKKKDIAESAWSKEVSVQIEGKSEKKILPDENVVLRGIEPEEIEPEKKDAKVEITPDKPMSDSAALANINHQRVAFYQRMIAVDIDSLGAEHPSVARDLTGLASIYLSQRKYDEAKPLLARALKIYETVYKTNSRPVKDTKFLLELISQVNFDQFQAGPVYVSYVDELPLIPLQARQLEMALRLNDLAFMCYSQGKIQTALKIYYWALASTVHSSGEQSLLAAASMTDMSSLLALTGRGTDAENMKNNAYTIWRRHLTISRSRLLP